MLNVEVYGFATIIGLCVGIGVCAACVLVVALFLRRCGGGAAKETKQVPHIDNEEQPLLNDTALELGSWAAGQGKDIRHHRHEGSAICTPVHNM